MAKRMSREQRKREIINVLRENSEEGGYPLSCREIARKMGMRGYSYVNTLLAEMSDDGVICVNVHYSNKAISNVAFAYYV